MHNTPLEASTQRKRTVLKRIVEFYNRTILILILTELNDRAFWLSKPTQWCDGCMRYHHKSINIYLCYSICSFSSLSFFFRSLNVMQSKPLLLSTMITMTSSKCTDYMKRMRAIRDIIQWHGGCTSLNITV